MTELQLAVKRFDLLSMSEDSTAEQVETARIAVYVAANVPQSRTLDGQILFHLAQRDKNRELSEFMSARAVQCGWPENNTGLALCYATVAGELNLRSRRGT